MRGKTRPGIDSPSTNDRRKVTRKRVIIRNQRRKKCSHEKKENEKGWVLYLFEGFCQIEKTKIEIIDIDEDVSLYTVIFQ